MRTTGAVRVGSKSSSENATIAEIYAVALEREKIAVERHLNIGDSKSVMAALRRGDIDVYPEDIRIDLYETLKPSYERRYGVTWLTPAPVNNSPCLATSQYIANEYWLVTLTKCAAIAPQLRFAGSRDFLASGALEGLRRLYGDFKFKSVISVDEGAQYDALSRDDVDVVNGSTVSPRIAEKQLIVLSDGKRFWPQYHVAPVVRVAATHTHPRLRAILDRASRKLTQYAVQQMNMRLDLLDMDPRDVAKGIPL
jgi:glycine betaine/choline ABC-type transport system substrate-binding protein